MTPAMFIGDFTTVSDVKLNIPFSGKTNKFIREAITLYRMEEWSYLTNLVKCDKNDSNKYYIRKCLPNLIKEIHKVRPKLIIAVGAVVLKTLLENENIIMRNEVNRPRAYANSILIPIYSPAYIAKEKAYKEYDISFNIISNILAKIDNNYAIWR